MKAKSKRKGGGADEDRQPDLEEADLGAIPEAPPDYKSILDSLRAYLEHLADSDTGNGLKDQGKLHYIMIK